MQSSSVSKFTDPYPYQEAIRGADVTVVPMVRGDFRAEITRIGFPQQLSASRFSQSLPTIRVTAMRSWMASIGFLTESNQPAMRYGGVDLSSDEIIVYAPETSIHSRTSAECRYGTITLSPDVLTATARTLTDRDISLRRMSIRSPRKARPSPVGTGRRAAPRAAPRSSPAAFRFARPC